MTQAVPGAVRPDRVSGFSLPRPRAGRARTRDAPLRAGRGDLVRRGARPAGRASEGCARPTASASTDCSRCCTGSPASATSRRRSRRRSAARPARPPPAAAALLEALYSEGLAELAYTNGLAGLPRPSGSRRAGRAPAPRAAYGGPQTRRSAACSCRSAAARTRRWRSRSSGARAASSRCSRSATRRRSRARSRSPGCRICSSRRTLDPGLPALNDAGALNGHVPITAIVSCVALLTAALHGFDAVAMANERSASAGNVSWDGVEVNHQFSKGLRAERLLSAAVAEVCGGLRLFSVLRPASELAIARAFARMERYHGAFTSCNAIFRIDPALRAASWCCDCPKCRFVFLALAPFSEPEHLREIFGRDLLDDEQPVRGLRAAHRHRRAQAVRVRGRGAGEPRRDPPARERPALERASRACGAWWPRCCRGIPPTWATPTRCSRSATSTPCQRPCWRMSVRFSELDGASDRRVGRRPRDRAPSPISSRAACPRRGSSWRPSTRLRPTACARR